MWPGRRYRDTVRYVSPLVLCHRFFHCWFHRSDKPGHKCVMSPEYISQHCGVWEHEWMYPRTKELDSLLYFVFLLMPYFTVISPIRCTAEFFSDFTIIRLWFQDCCHWPYHRKIRFSSNIPKFFLSTFVHCNSLWDS